MKLELGMTLKKVNDLYFVFRMKYSQGMELIDEDGNIHEITEFGDFKEFEVVSDDEFYPKEFLRNLVCSSTFSQVFTLNMFHPWMEGWTSIEGTPELSIEKHNIHTFHICDQGYYLKVTFVGRRQGELTRFTYECPLEDLSNPEGWKCEMSSYDGEDQVRELSKKLKNYEDLIKEIHSISEV